MVRARRALLIASAAIFAGCATPGRDPQPIAGGSPKRLWSGRFAATYPDAQAQGGRSRASGRFKLERQSDGQILLELASPLGQLIARGRVGRDHAELEDARGTVHRAASDQLLTESLFGWRIPVRALPDWLEPPAGPSQGVSAAGAGPAGLQGEAQLSQGWSIRRALSPSGQLRSLDLTYPAGEVQGLRLQLVIDSAG
jgi:outer membrane biogenesis lipoprotein LolB